MNFFRRSDHYEPLPNTASANNGSFEVEVERGLESVDASAGEQGDLPLSWSSPIPGKRTWDAPLKGALERCRSFMQRNAGLLLVGSSQAFFALMNVFVKVLNSLDPPMPALQLIFVRMAITYVCCVSYMILTGVSNPFWGPKEVRRLLFFRGFSGFFGLFGVYYSLQYLSLSDATVLTFLAPSTTAIAGYFLLGERFARKEAAAGLLSLLGVILIARPRSLFGASSPADHAPSAGEISRSLDEVGGGEDGVTSAQRLIAVGVAMIGVLGATGAYTSIRAIGKRAHPMHSMIYFSMMCVTTSAGSMIFLHEPVVLPTQFLWFMLLMMIGIFGFLAQTLLTMGLQRETAGRGTIAVYVQIIFASILERIVFHTVPSLMSIAGTLIIVGSALYVAVCIVLQLFWPSY
ncbi:DUF6-domain-containing protein [Schizopora paradoxa]|uniref:DUF6-domain-containing protein n=1 Tax=Schizopora paradoxa TaxID=27342 RepID=A0A0H2RVW0_9AGAM|nr:DUF6-domain-containing protein [Schizopora paradoxa]